MKSFTGVFRPFIASGSRCPSEVAHTSMTSSSNSKSARKADAAAVETAVAPSYEAAIQELEGLVGQLDAGQLPLDQLLSRYQRGSELLAFCRERLDAVENQIRVLESNELKPWDNA
jgi:exodeoxyribonuclease VII small subunit